MNKLDKIFSFHISETEKQAIEIIRIKNFNVSRFLSVFFDIKEKNP